MSQFLFIGQLDFSAYVIKQDKKWFPHKLFRTVPLQLQEDLWFLLIFGLRSRYGGRAIINRPYYLCENNKFQIAKAEYTSNGKTILLYGSLGHFVSLKSLESNWYWRRS